MIKMILAMSIILSGCINLKFEKDLNFMGSAIANSPEFLVNLNNKPCVDTDDMVGYCAKRVKSNQDLVISILPQQYAYNFILDCTDAINSDFKADVLPTNEPFTHTIKAEKYGKATLFNCTVDILPQDRPEPVSAFARFQVVVVDGEYVTLDSVVSQGRYLVLGRHSYYSSVGGKTFKEKTWLKDQDGPVIVESYHMRYSYRDVK